MRRAMQAAMAIAAIVGGAQPGGAHESEISVVLTGQSLITNDIRRAGDAFRATAPLLEGDVVFTNFETTVRAPGASIAEMDPVSGTYGPPEALDALKEQGFNLLAMANNHIYDIGEGGITATMQGADRLGLTYSGIGANLDRASAPGYLSTPKGKVALVSMATGYLHGRGRATASQPGLNELAIDGGDVTGTGQLAPEDEARNLARIQEARRNADLVVVSHHNHVYDTPFFDLMMARSPDRLRPPAWVRSWARKEIDAGADIVAMHGAPFLQGVEIYKGRPIFYDLGNYIFQVDPKYIGVFGEQAGESAVVRATFSGRRLREIKFYPIVLDPAPSGEGPAAEAARGLPAPAGAKGEAILARLAELSKELGTELRVVDGVATLVLPHEEAVQ